MRAFYGKIEIGDNMVKFSIIVPVYNVEKYLSACLDSIIDQSYENFEAIVVNDGTKDNSQEIIDEYVKKDKRIRGFIKENGGLSDARNYGVKKAKGEYLVFVDSDDDINPLLLEKLNEEIEKNNPDLIRFQIAKVSTDIVEDKSALFENVDGVEAFKTLATNEFFVTAWSCCYNKKFWLANEFQYEKGFIHEDYGLTPYVYIKAKKVSAIDYVGYNYYVRENSIMNDKDYKKEEKKNNDVIKLFDINIKRIDKDKEVSLDAKKLLRSYMANGLITKCAAQEGELFDKMFKEVKKRSLFIYLMNDTLGRKMKRVFYKLMPKTYIKHFK